VRPSERPNGRTAPAPPGRDGVQRIELPGDASLRLLRYFLVLSGDLHFGRAARRLGMSQSALSRAIMVLERQLGACLIDRSGGRTITLTPAGVSVVDHAARLLCQQRLMLDDLAAIAETVPRRLHSVEGSVPPYGR
jgi:DNA-binding transcriptional LysR family regulator